MVRRQRLRLSRRGGVLFAVLCFALTLPGGAFSYHIWQYFGTATIRWSYAEASGTNYLQMNRVYRPTPKTFALWYNTSQGYQYEENRNTNPFEHNNPGGYTNANCADVDPYVHTGTPNTTCQYKSFHP